MSAHDIVITCSQVPMTLDASPSTRDDPFLLVNDDALSRLQASIGLLPARGGAIKRRALAYALVAWLPLAVASWFSAKAGGHDAALNETLLGHYGIHIRCLIAIPLLVLAEGIAQKNLALCLNEFKRSGLVDQALAPRFDAVVEGVARLKKRMYPWIIVGTLAAAWTAVFLISPNPDEVQWAGPRSDSLGFGAWWFLLVSRPLFCVLLLAWIWRLTLVGHPAAAHCAPAAQAGGDASGPHGRTGLSGPAADGVRAVPFFRVGRGRRRMGPYGFLSRGDRAIALSSGRHVADRSDTDRAGAAADVFFDAGARQAAGVAGLRRPAIRTRQAGGRPVDS